MSESARNVTRVLSQIKNATLMAEISAVFFPLPSILKKLARPSGT